MSDGRKLILSSLYIIKIMNSSSYPRVLPIKYYKIVSPVLLLELINDFAVSKHCRGTLLPVQKQSPRGVLQNLFLEISQNSKENTCGKVSFIKVCLNSFVFAKQK